MICAIISTYYMEVFMSNFIRNLRNKLSANSSSSVTDSNNNQTTTDISATKQPIKPVDKKPKDLSVGDPLKEFSKFDFNDSMNCVYIIDDLRESNRYQDAKDAFDSFNRHNSFANSDVSLGPFLSYLYEKNELEKTIVKSQSNKQKNNNELNESNEQNNTPLTDNDKLISAIIIEETTPKLDMTYETLTKFLDISHGRPAELDKSEFAMLSKLQYLNDDVRTIVTKNIVDRYPIPEVTQITDIYDTDDLSDLYDKYKKDNYFKNNYKIKNIYAVEHNKQSENAHKYGKNKLTLNSGTANESLIKIMNGGFKRPSQLARENNVQISGQMYGDAVYFAKPDQISKNTSYVDRRTPVVNL